jgi:phage tail sheath gpL-like
MPLDSTTEVAVVGSAAVNTQFAPVAANIPARILVIANYDPAKTAIVQNTVYSVLSPEQAGDLFGFGFQAHRLVRAAWKGSQGVPMYVMPVDDDAAGVQGAGEIDYTGTTSASAGNVYFYIAGELVQIPVAKGDDATTVGDTTVTKITNDTNLPVTASNLAGVVTITAKDSNIDTNDISLTVNQILGQETAEGVTLAITDMAAGAGIMLNDMATALNALGTGDQQNQDYYTEIIHGWSVQTAVLDDLSEYNGEGNDKVGNWSATVHRPFRTLSGDVATGSSGLTAAKALGNGRKTLDRTNGLISVPGSPNHPAEIAATVLGYMARFNQEDPNRTMNGVALSGVLPGKGDDDWTKDVDSRNDAVKAGVSPTYVTGGAVEALNVLTFYHPDSVTSSSNGYKSQFSISKVRNITHNNWANFNRQDWKQVTVVADKATVTDPAAKLKVRDTKDVQGELIALAEAYAAKGWLYTDTFTIERIQNDPTLVVLRVGTDGWTITFPALISGEGNVFDQTTIFDTSVTILNQ